MNDAQQSNLTFATVIELGPDGYHRINVGDLVASQSTVGTRFREYGHLYLAGVRWQGDHRLEVRIDAWDPIRLGIERHLQVETVVSL